MTTSTQKADLHRSLRAAREALLWKLDGLSERDARRPLTPTGTNLLGLVKHVASVEAGYFGATFGRPFPEPMPWHDEGAEANADMYADASESRGQVLAFAGQAWAHADATIEALPLDAPGEVAWWPPDRSAVTLHQVLVHVVAEVHRHVGHADIVRELVDGSAGLRAGNPNLAPGDEQWWVDYRARLELLAREAEA